MSRRIPHAYDDLDERDSFPAVVAKRAERTPDRVWVVDITNDRTMTYGEGHALGLTWADALRKLGVQPGERVAVMMPNSIETAAAWLGCGWARAYEVPLNTAFRGYMLEYGLQNSGARVALVAERFLPQLAEVIDNTPLEIVVVVDASTAPAPLGTTGVRVMTGAEFLADAVPDPTLPVPQSWDIATIAYTSGTTGPSKGVLLPWGMLIFGIGLIDDLTADDTLYSPFPMFHMAGKGMLSHAAYMGGREVIREAFDTGSFWDDIDTHGCTFTLIVPAMAQWLIAQPPTDNDRSHALQQAVLSPVIHAFGDRFGVRMRTHYGMTEAGNVMSRPHVTDESPSCGKPREGYDVRLVDEHDYEVPVGEVGELMVRTQQPWWLSIGYWGMAEKTAEAWRNGWFHTGDGFRRDEEGNYYFVDRQKDALRRRGENISSFEVEGIVVGHPAVAECAAIAADIGGGEQEIKVCVVVAPGAELTPEELIEYLIPKMPRFMVPRFVEIVDGLPKTEATMRTQKAKLRENALNDNTWDREAAGVVVPK
jgi:crotonobetaine/carnitine-CoA ligase